VKLIITQLCFALTGLPFAKRPKDPSSLWEVEGERHFYLKCIFEFKLFRQFRLPRMFRLFRLFVEKCYQVKLLTNPVQCLLLSSVAELYAILKMCTQHVHFLHFVSIHHLYKSRLNRSTTFINSLKHPPLCNKPRFTASYFCWHSFDSSKR